MSLGLAGRRLALRPDGVATLVANNFWTMLGHSPPLRATLVRAIGFFLFASAYWALLPLVARDQIAAGPTLYGMLLGAIGAGAVLGALGLPWLKNKLEPDQVVAAGSVGTAVSLTLFGW